MLKLTRTKLVILVVLSVLLLGGAYLGYGFSRMMRLFGAEDQIHGDFYPVICAIYDYADAHKDPPAQLSDLVPAQLAAIPKCKAVDSISYHPHPDGKSWRLTLRSSVCGERRLYCWDSEKKFTEAESAQIIGRYHGGWTVMNEQD